MSHCRGFGSWLLLEDIADVWKFDGIRDPDSYDPESVATIEAEAIATLADLETALKTIAADRGP